MAEEDDDAVDKEEAEKEEGEEGAAEGEEGGEGKPKKSKKKLIIIAVGIIVLFAGAGAGAYFGGVFDSSESSASHAGTEEITKTYLDLPEFLVNLNTSSRSSSFLKMVIVIDLVNEADKPTIEANMPRILDSFNAYLRELRPSDLYGSAGLYRLREELLARVNKIVAPAQVNDILFKQILIQ